MHEIENISNRERLVWVCMLAVAVLVPMIVVYTRATSAFIIAMATAYERENMSKQHLGFKQMSIIAGMEVELIYHKSRPI